MDSVLLLLMCMFILIYVLFYYISFVTPTCLYRKLNFDNQYDLWWLDNLFWGYVFFSLLQAIIPIPDMHWLREGLQHFHVKLAILIGGMIPKSQHCILD